MGPFVPLSPSCMEGFLLGPCHSHRPERRVVPLLHPSHFGEQMRVLSCDVISFSAFFVSPPSMPENFPLCQAEVWVYSDQRWFCWVRRSLTRGIPKLLLGVLLGSPSCSPLHVPRGDHSLGLAALMAQLGGPGLRQTLQSLSS